MFARGRHFRVRTFASIYSSTQDTDYNIKVTRQNWLGLLKQKMETVGCGSCKQYIIGWYGIQIQFFFVYLQGSITIKVQICYNLSSL